jgi:hypothetical protein
VVNLIEVRCILNFLLLPNILVTDTFLRDYKKRENDIEAGYIKYIDASSSRETVCKSLNSENVIHNISVCEEERPQCLLYMQILAADSMEPNKLGRYLRTVQAEYVPRTLEFFYIKLKELNKQKQTFAKITTVISKPWLASL